MIEGLAPKRILVGHSMGGAHVAAVAATRPDLATDKVKPLDELLEVGCRNNPGWVAEDLEPWPESTRPSTPLCPLALRQLRHRPLAGHHGEVSCSTLCHR